MDTYGMSKDWGALEEALSPQRQQLLKDLLEGKPAVDPGSVSITEGAPPPRPEWMRSGTFGAPGASGSSTAEPASAPAPAPAPDSAPPPSAAPSPAKLARLSVYDTVYADKIRAAEKSVKDAFWGYQHKNAREDLDRWLGMAERDIARAEGRETFDATQSRADRRSENELAKSVLDSSAEDSYNRFRNRATEEIRKLRQLSRSAPVDRGEDGTWQQVVNNETGEAWWEQADIPAKRPREAAPNVQSLGSNGSVYFKDGKPVIIGAPKKGDDLAGVREQFARGWIEANKDSLRDPNALPRLTVAMRDAGLLPASQAPAAPAPRAPGAVPPPTPGAPAAPAGRIAVDPKTGERYRVVNGQKVPLR